MVFSGYDGKIELCEGCVKIWKGKNDSGHTVKLSDIMFVTLCKPGLTCAGCLFIQVLGAKTYKSWANATHYATDINAVCFRKPQYEETIQFKEALEAALSHHKEAGTSTEINVASLKDLKQLLDEGIITEDDYNKKKNQILGI